MHVIRETFNIYKTVTYHRNGKIYLSQHKDYERMTSVAMGDQLHFIDETPIAREHLYTDDWKSMSRGTGVVADGRLFVCVFNEDRKKQHFPTNMAWDHQILTFEEISEKTWPETLPDASSN